MTAAILTYESTNLLIHCFFFTPRQTLFTLRFVAPGPHMNPFLARGMWLRTFTVLSGLILFVLTGCASVVPDEVKSAPAVSAASLPSEDDDWTQLRTQMRIDLTRYNTREISRTPMASSVPSSAQA